MLFMETEVVVKISFISALQTTLQELAEADSYKTIVIKLLIKLCWDGFVLTNSHWP